MRRSFVALLITRHVPSLNSLQNARGRRRSELGTKTEARSLATREVMVGPHRHGRNLFRIEFCPKNVSGKLQFSARKNAGC